MAVDLSLLTSSVDFSSTLVAIVGVSAALIVVYVAWKAAFMVLAAVSGNTVKSISLAATPVAQITEAEFNRFPSEHKDWLGVVSYADYKSRYTSY